VIVPLDFETESIEKRPEYPPKPVGVAVRFGRGGYRYLAWGHPTENNCTKTEANKVVRDIFRNHTPLMHNAAFDIDVAMSFMGAKFPKDFHDTLFLAYLHDPRDKSLSLKPLAEKYLGMSPKEQDMLREWILANVPEALPETKKNPAGKYICRTPGMLCAKYARGDIIRTEKLFKLFYPYIKDNGMLESYEREKRVMPVFNDMSEGGVKVAVRRLKKDVRKWQSRREGIGKVIRSRLKTKDLDISSPKQLADALDRTGKIIHWIKTPKGNKSTSRENLITTCIDKKLVELLSIYAVYGTYISTFGLPWIEAAEKSNGYIHPNFNQVRSPDEYGSGSKGTRTGRPSSNNPNFFNVPRNPNDPSIKWTMELPRLREYLIPDEGCVFLNRDYSQQELRILAHFEDSVLMQAYLKDPTMDVHAFIGGLITECTGLVFPRKHIKVLNFGVVYGMGVPGLMKKIGCSREEASSLKKAHAKALPAIGDLNKEIKRMSKRGDPIVTWGGRQYYTEEPKIINGHLRKFEYKLLNYLIQGSAADVTKEAMCRVASDLKSDSRVVLQVYDELMINVPKGTEKKNMKLLQESMESVQMDVPMLSDGKKSSISWGKAKPYEVR